MPFLILFPSYVSCERKFFELTYLHFEQTVDLCWSRDKNFSKMMTSVNDNYLYTFFPFLCVFYSLFFITTSIKVDFKLIEIFRIYFYFVLFFDCPFVCFRQKENNGCSWSSIKMFRFVTVTMGDMKSRSLLRSQIKLSFLRLLSKRKDLFDKIIYSLSIFVLGIFPSLNIGFLWISRENLTNCLKFWTLIGSRVYNLLDCSAINSVGKKRATAKETRDNYQRIIERNFELVFSRAK